MGRACDRPSGLPRSYSEAQRARQVRLASGSTGGVTRFDELGIYRLLAAGTGDGEVQAFVGEWLGALHRSRTQRREAAQIGSDGTPAAVPALHLHVDHDHFGSPG